MKQRIGLGKLNQPILSWMVNHRSPVVTDIAKIVTSVANPYFFALIVGLIVISWIIIKHEIWRPVVLASAIAVAAITSTLLKTVFMDARPPQIDMIPAFEYDFSFPSGHTISMAVFLLVLGYFIYSRRYSVGKFWTWIAIAIIGTGLVAFSRLYLGYHWLTDVVASVGLALIILAIVIVVDTFFIRKYKSKRFFSNIDR
jgi:undecaprenyl-diphosphatase